MTEKQWEIDLQQIRQLMRNEVVNHDRIKDRVIHLRDLYAEGQVNDCAITWESWAVSYFANSPQNLRRMLNPHPNTLEDKFAKQQRKRDDDEADHQLKLAALNTKLENAAEIAAAKKRIAQAKKKAAQPKKPVQLELVPPHELMVPLINAIGIVERKSRIEMGEIFSQAQALVKAKQVGRDPATGKHWGWTVYGPRYFKRTRKSIWECIQAYNENVTAGNISEDDTAGNVTVFPKSIA
jgi:hypothetical protein